MAGRMSMVSARYELWAAGCQGNTGVTVTSSVSTRYELWTTSVQAIQV